jgi:hypothetical protein
MTVLGRQAGISAVISGVRFWPIVLKNSFLFVTHPPSKRWILDFALARADFAVGFDRF